MLSPHEVATLLLLKNSPERIEVDRIELGALHEWQLIESQPGGTGFPVPRVTPRGEAVLRAIARIR